MNTASTGLACISERIGAHARKKRPHTRTTAAVLLPILAHDGRVDLVFTKRVMTLAHHGGEVSFPGGRFEEYDGTHKETALRETCEEIGVTPDEVDIVGALDDEISIHGVRVTPYVGVIPNRPDMSPQADEVARIYTIPITHFTNPAIHWQEQWVRNGMLRTVYFYRYENDIIWGLTGRILFKFMNILGNCVGGDGKNIHGH